MGWNRENLLKAFKVVMERKPEIVEAAKQVEGIGLTIYNLCASALSAYEALKFGTYSRSVTDEDALSIIEEYGQE